MRRSGLLTLEASILKGATPVGGPIIDARRAQRGGFVSGQDRATRALAPPTLPVPVRESAFATLSRYLLGWQIDPRFGTAGNRYPAAQTHIGMVFKVPTKTHDTRSTPAYSRPRPRFTKVLPYPRPGELDLPRTYGPYSL